MSLPLLLHSCSHSSCSMSLSKPDLNCYENSFDSFLSSYTKALQMVASGAVNVRPLITHHYKLADTLSAFERAKSGADGAIKVMIHCSE